jgi:hypothetical protein
MNFGFYQSTYPGNHMTKYYFLTHEFGCFFTDFYIPLGSIPVRCYGTVNIFYLKYMVRIIR